MATLFSVTPLTVSASSSMINRLTVPFQLNSMSFLSNPLSFPSGSFYMSSRVASRKLNRIQATTLQDKEEKVVVEDSFQSKSLSDSDVKGSHGKLLESASESSSDWAVKIEQSINIFLTDSVITVLDTLYHDRHYARFYVLETIARVPYFAFMSILHMYESFGWWRRADYLKVHFAESWNELHHLLIMEELGGNSMWFDRFLAQHIAIFYYFMTALMYSISPRMAYHFSECVERHAFETYDKFIILQGEELKKLPAPEIAVKYYTGGDLYLFGGDLYLFGELNGPTFLTVAADYLFERHNLLVVTSLILLLDEFQTARVPNTRRPKIENLYDVFVNIRDDEAEHCKTMKACQDHGTLRSPHSLLNDEEDEAGCDLTQANCEGFVDCLKKSLTPQKE